MFSGRTISKMLDLRNRGTNNNAAGYGKLKRSTRNGATSKKRRDIITEAPRGDKQRFPLGKYQPAA